VARAVSKPRCVALVALIALLPDIDALLRVHRWVPHSIPLTLLVTTPILTLVYYRFRKYLRFAAIALLIYVLHIALDLFTVLTPALWSLHSSIWIRIELTGALTTSGVRIAPGVEVVTRPADFTQRDVVEGLLVTETGLALGVVAAILTALDAIRSRAKQQIPTGCG